MKAETSAAAEAVAEEIIGLLSMVVRKKVRQAFEEIERCATTRQEPCSKKETPIIRAKYLGKTP